MSILPDRINRNIVECKSPAIPLLTKEPTSINRNIVECKYVIIVSNCAAPVVVLIETLWNVNTIILIVAMRVVLY